MKNYVAKWIKKDYEGEGWVIGEGEREEIEIENRERRQRERR